MFDKITTTNKKLDGSTGSSEITISDGEMTSEEEVTPGPSSGGTKLYLHTITYLCTDTNDELKLMIHSSNNTPATDWQAVRDLLRTCLFFQGLAVNQATSDKYILLGNGMAITYGLAFNTNLSLNHTDLGSRSCLIAHSSNGGQNIELVNFMIMGSSPARITVTDVVTEI